MGSNDLIRILMESMYYNRYPNHKPTRLYPNLIYTTRLIYIFNISFNVDYLA